jgi:MFS family permease
VAHPDVSPGDGRAAKPGFRALAAEPGFPMIFLASLVARLPAAVTSVLLILRVRETGGSYADGGAVVAAYFVAAGVTAPLLSRVIDRVGQTRVLVFAMPLYVAALVSVAAAPTLPVGVLCVLAALIGVTYPQVGGMVRAVMASIFPDDGRRHAAFALESVGAELLFVTSPAIFVGGIASHAGAGTALGVAAAVSVSGCVAFGLSRRSREWTPTPAPASGRPGRLATPQYLFMVSLFVAIGFAFGGIEVALTSFSEQQGNRNDVGFFLALNALGSLLGGLSAVWVGASKLPIRRVAGLLAAAALTEAGLALPRSSAAMALAVLLAGATIAPTLSTVYAMISAIVPTSRITEGFSWIATALMGGSSVGVFVAGSILTRASPQAVFVVVAMPSAVAAMATWVVRSRFETAVAQPTSG